MPRSKRKLAECKTTCHFAHNRQGQHDRASDNPLTWQHHLVIPFSAFWLRSSVVSVLRSVKTMTVTLWPRFYCNFSELPPVLVLASAGASLVLAFHSCLNRGALLHQPRPPHFLCHSISTFSHICPSLTFSPANMCYHSQGILLGDWPSIGHCSTQVLYSISTPPCPPSPPHPSPGRRNGLQRIFPLPTASQCFVHPIAGLPDP